MTKADARTEGRRRRAMLSSDDRNYLSLRLADVFFDELDLTGVRSLNAYYPLAKLNEPETLMLLHRLHRDRPDINLSIPYLPEEGGDVSPVRWEPDMEMTLGGQGTHRPAELDKLLFSELDLVLVPLLAIDGFGYRAGYGAGHYDRFLAKCRPQIRKVGVSFFQPIEAIDDVYEGDIRLDACLTPDGLIVFGPEAGIRK